MRSWIASAGIHALAVAGLFTLRVAELPPPAPRRPTHVVELMTVVPAKPAVRTVIRRPEAPRLPRVPARHAIPSPAVIRPRPVAVPPMLAAVPSLQLVVPQAAAPVFAAPQLDVLPPPPLRTDNLAAVAVAVAAPASTANLRAAGFSAVATDVVRKPAAALARADFGDAAFAAPDPAAPRAARSVLAAEPSKPVEILAKPRPAYTEEARRLQLEGEVLLEVLFAAGGAAQVTRVLRSLGHGLDENAVAAATSIRYRPAEKAGVPVDTTATVHIVFQLAY